MAADIDPFQPNPSTFKNFPKGDPTMKKIAIELFIIAASVMAYVLPVMADGGGY